VHNDRRPIPSGTSHTRSSSGLASLASPMLSYGGHPRTPTMRMTCYINETLASRGWC